VLKEYMARQQDKKETTALNTLISGGDALVGRQKKQDPQLKGTF
jgi:hypothetical protein